MLHTENSCEGAGEGRKGYLNLEEVSFIRLTAMVWPNKKKQTLEYERVILNRM